MQALLGSNLSFLSVPQLPVDLSIEEAHLIIPEGFESILVVSKSDGDLKLELKNDEYKDNVITIPSSLFNPSKNKVSYPNFLVLQKDKKIDYFNDLTNRYILNQNEIMYIVLQHRLSLFLGRNVAYSYLLKRDISAVKSFVQHVKAYAYNAISKNDNSYITMDVFNDDLSLKGLFGDLIHYRSFVPSVKLFMDIKSYLPIQFSSESNVGKLGKLILRPYEEGSLFRSPGHKLFQDPQGNWTLKSLFKSAQNVVARNKTHVTANAYKRYNFQPTSNFIEDWVYDAANYPVDDPILEGYKPKDHCYRRALVMIVPMNHDTKRFLFGEAEVSQDYYDDWIWEDLKVLECFESMDIPTDGTIVFAQPKIVDKLSNQVIEYENFIKIGTKFEAGKVEDIIIKDVFGVQYVKSKSTNGPLGKERITFRVIRRPGNARCDSNTGFKAVTKGKPYLGKLVLDNGKEHKFDMAFGMNSFKAKQNGIVCARAALAVDLNMYQPKHWSGLLNTQDVEEMQNASDSLTGYKVYDENGNQLTNVQVGVIYYRYTEPCKIFKSYRLQTLSHEAARNMHRNDDKSLFEFIHKNYINSEMKEAMIEFQRILTMSDIFEGDEELPYYSYKDVIKNKLFTRDELFNSTLRSSRANPKYLNPEFNPKGFFLDFRSEKGPLIRVPSASILSLFESELETGEWMYHRIFISLNKILMAILDNKIYFIFDRNLKSTRTNTLSARYFQDIKGVIFTSEDKAEMNITCFTRPNVPGFAMKQVCEPLLPEGTALIMCQKTYNKAVKNCYGEDHDYHTLVNSFYGLHVRNPS